MADKTIGELPSLTTMEDDTLIPVEHDGVAKKMAGTVLESYIYGCVEDDVETIAEIIAVGPAGVSPTLSASKVGGTTTVSYTDVDHPTSTVLATINDGTNGVTPTLSSSKSGKTTTIYYTDATHTSGTDVLATVQDGQDGTGVGDMLKSTYDTDNDGVVDDSEKLGGYEPSHYATLDSDSKITATQATAKQVTISSDTTLSATHNSCRLLVAGAYTITVPSGLSAGFECEVVNYSSGTVYIRTQAATFNGEVAPSEAYVWLTSSNKYDVEVLAALTSTDWLVKGDFA